LGDTVRLPGSKGLHYHPEPMKYQLSSLLTGTMDGTAEVSSVLTTAMVFFSQLASWEFTVDHFQSIPLKAELLRHVAVLRQLIL